MSEDVTRPRPVTDPQALQDPHESPHEPASGRSTTRDPCSRGSGGEATTRPGRLREGAVQVVGAGLTLSLALATGGWYLGMVIATVSLIAFTVVLGLGRDVHPATRAVGVLVGAGTIASVSTWAMDAVPRDPFAGMPWLVFCVLVTLVAADALTGRARGATADDGPPPGAVLSPDDISEADHPRLLAVQRTIDLVAKAREVLGGSDSLDTDRALAVLREQEWRIASLLARQRELRRAHLRRWQRASSPRVREALKPQREHLAAVDDAVRARVAQITEYGRLVEQAVRTHREWEQCQEALDTTAEYTEHRASATLLDPGYADVGELSATAELARRVRDERVGRPTGHALVRSGTPVAVPGQVAVPMPRDCPVADSDLGALPPRGSARSDRLGA